MTGPLKLDKPSLQEHIKNIKNNNPGLKVRYFDDEMCINYITENCEQRILNAFNAIKPGAFKADLFRYITMVETHYL
jgi:mannosyltransferase OCH1-like enzyme